VEIQETLFDLVPMLSFFLSHRQYSIRSSLACPFVTSQKLWMR